MKSPQVLMISSIWPEPSSSAAGVRSWGLIRHFQAFGWKVAYASAGANLGFREALEREGIPTFEAPLNDSRFEALLLELRPEAVLLDRFVVEEQYGARVRAVCPEALRILDTQDLHSLRRARQDALARGEDPRSTLPHGEAWLRELASIHRSDLSFVVSEYEEKLLVRAGVAAERVAHLPILAIPALVECPQWESRSGIAVIGNFRHPPNLDGMRWLREEIWPEVRRALPEVSVHLYGAYPPREVSDWQDPTQGFYVEGPVPDAAQALSQHRLSLAPLRFGAGIKGKILESWRAGTPVVATSIGAEGMHPGEEFPGWIADDAKAFANTVARAYVDEASTKEKILQSRELLSRVYSFEAIQERFTASLLPVLRDLSRWRERNLFGEILWREEARSTEYFSRWVELKEKTQSQIRSSATIHV